MKGIYGSSAAIKSLIENYIDQGIEFDELTDQQLNNLTAEWLLANSPGNPFDGKDFFFDGLASNLELVLPILLRMTGRENPNSDITKIIEWGIREECKPCIEEYWDEVRIKLSQEAA